MQHHRRYRRAQQQVNVLSDALSVAKAELENARKGGAAGAGGRWDAEMQEQQAQLDSKREALIEQERALVESMQEASISKREAVLAKDGQEELLLKAVLQGSQEAFRAQQILAKEKDLEEQLEWQNTLVNDLALDH